MIDSSISELERFDQVTIQYFKREQRWYCEVWDDVNHDYWGEGDGETADEAVEQALIDLDRSRSETT